MPLHEKTFYYDLYPQKPFKIKGFGEHSTHSVAVIWDYINSRDQMAQIRALPQVFSAIAMEAIKKREQNAFLSPWRFLVQSVELHCKIHSLL